MIGSLPEGVVGVEAYADRWETELLPEERALVATAVKKRRHEFAAGRNCARRALAKLGWPDFPVLSGPNREPLWPPGVLGSITHCHGYCAAVAAPLAELKGILGIGIDAELNAQLPQGVVELVCRPSELGTLDKLTRGQQSRALVQREGVGLQGMVSGHGILARLSGCRDRLRSADRSVRGPPAAVCAAVE
jgi:4'-phosphopantetheinyl transferase EntD